MGAKVKSAIDGRDMKNCKQQGNSLFLSKASLSGSTHLEPNGISSTRSGKSLKPKSFCQQIQTDRLFRKKIIQTIILGWAFFFLGWSVSMFGPCFPDLMLILDTDLEKASWLFTIGAFGYLVGAMLGGVAYDRYNKMLLLFICMAGMAITNGAIPWCTSFPVMMTVIFMCGMFEGSIETGGNADVVSIWKEECSPFMLAIHFAYSAGGIISPFVIEPFLAKKEYTNTLISTNDKYNNGTNTGSVIEGIHHQDVEIRNSLFVSGKPLRSSYDAYSNSTLDSGDKMDKFNDTHYTFQTNSTHDYYNESAKYQHIYGETHIQMAFLIAGIMTILAAVPFLVLFLSASKVRLKTSNHVIKNIPDGKSVSGNQSYYLSLNLKIVSIFLLSFILFLYSAIEDNFVSLLMTFSISNLSWSKASGTVATSLAWISFAIGRLIGIFLVRHIKTSNILTAYFILLIISFIGLLICSLTGKSFLIWVVVPLAGFSQSVILPAVFTWTEEKILPVSGKLSGLYLVVASAGSMVTPLLFGYLMEEYSSHWYVYLLLAMSLLSAISFFIVRTTEHCLIRPVKLLTTHYEDEKSNLNGII